MPKRINTSEESDIITGYNPWRQTLSRQNDSHIRKHSPYRSCVAIARGVGREERG